MQIVFVYIHVKPDVVEQFMEVTRDNVLNSQQEPGIARFDLIQQADDPTRFVLVEVYKTAEAPAQNKETAHYLRWRDAVADLMAEPRTSTKYAPILPETWG